MPTQGQPPKSCGLVPIKQAFPVNKFGDDQRLDRLTRVTAAGRDGLVRCCIELVGVGIGLGVGR